MSDRAVSNTVGVILIFGITIASVTALIAVGGAVIDDTRADAERSQMENSMSGFSSKASLVGLGEAGDQRFSLGRASEGQVDVREDAGRVHVYLEDAEGETDTIGETSMGSVVYRNGDREIAYQGGGVWERQGDFSRMISPPEFHYRAETLTFPIINVTGDGSAAGDVRGTVRSDADSTQLYPNTTENEGFENPLTNGTVYVEIESEYCRGWESFFEARSQGGVDEPCDEGPSDTVIIDLTVDIDPTFGAAVTAGTYNEPNSQASDVSNYRDGRYAPSATEKINDEVQSCLESGNDCKSFSESDTLSQPGTYYTENMDDFADLNFNNDDDVFVVLNDTDGAGVEDPGDMVLEGDGNVTVYVKTDEGFKANGGEINSGGDPAQFRMYLTSGVKIRLGGNVEYTGVLYSRGSTFNDSGPGTISVTGAIVVGTFDIKGGGNAEFNFDPGVTSVEPDFDANTAKYLHVSENEVRVELG